MHVLFYIICAAALYFSTHPRYFKMEIRVDVTGPVKFTRIISFRLVTTDLCE